MYVGEGGQKLHGTQNKSVFQHSFHMHPHESFASSCWHWEEEELPDEKNVKHSNVSLLNMILEIPRVKWILYSRLGAQDFSKYVFFLYFSLHNKMCSLQKQLENVNIQGKDHRGKQFDVVLYKY